MQLGAGGSDAWVAPDRGTMAGYFVRGPDGHARGLWWYGGSDALAAGVNERGISVGVGSGGCDQGDGKECGRGGIGLVDRLTGTCKIKENSDSKKMSKQRINIQCAKRY